MISAVNDPSETDGLSATRPRYTPGDCCLGTGAGGMESTTSNLGTTV